MTSLTVFTTQSGASSSVTPSESGMSTSTLPPGRPDMLIRSTEPARSKRAKPNSLPPLPMTDSSRVPRTAPSRCTVKTSSFVHSSQGSARMSAAVASRSASVTSGITIKPGSTEAQCIWRASAARNRVTESGMGRDAKPWAAPARASRLSQ
ncbi:hypothetical protein QEG98_00220 [Myxococcus sp. MxC21-1]|uniref:hypothetical protein n=1 Tax=Myxococcus sp. MxC21-1 TaxID=3041439 RepID=UPI0029316CE6|nr:hypothetical protein [Myxococcus sp. MxC21-1]WNZ62324.1 hypothetical protein QEG98_00220 [Myxococcus sp. MxC21-1]